MSISDHRLSDAEYARNFSDIHPPFETRDAALVDANFKSRVAALGGMVLPGSPADFGNLIRDETEKWGKVIRAANIKGD